MKVVLASGSPQRSEILRKLGVEFEVVVSGVDELTGGDPDFEVLENARLKARAVARDGVVIACDTDVVLDGKALGKPAAAAEARSYLDRMSGRAHEVLSGLVVVADGEERSGLERTTVVFKELSEAEKERYVRLWRVAGALRRLRDPDAWLDPGRAARGERFQRGRPAGRLAARSCAGTFRSSADSKSTSRLVCLG